MTAPPRRLEDRNDIGIVHIGPGAFHRAHQAIYTQNAIRNKEEDWQIGAVSLRSRSVADALNAQDGKYTLVVRGEQGTEYQAIDIVKGVLAAEDGIAPIRELLDRPQTRIVSLTVTEKAYVVAENPETENLNVVSLLTASLERRMKAGVAPFTALSCDNLTDNGAVLRKAVLSDAQQRSPELVEWISTKARFPSTMVDRITPATTTELLAEVKQATGWADQAPVETEAFSQWVIEDNFVDRRPLWENAGALLVSDVAPYEQMKLRMLNGAHSLLAYAGHVAGKKHVRDVMADAAFAELVSRHMDAAAATLDPLNGVSLPAYRDALISRFRNPHLAHETYQIAMDGTQKLPQRIFAPALDAIDRGQNVEPFAFATAAWIRYLNGKAEDGSAYALRDPRETELTALPLAPGAKFDAIFGLPDFMPPQLAANNAFRIAVAAYSASMTEKGVAETIREALNG